MKRPRSNPEERGSTWRPPTRRTFVAMLGAAAAAFAIREQAGPVEPERPHTARPRWIGHC